MENFSQLQNLIKETLDISGLIENQSFLFKEIKQLNTLEMQIKRQSCLFEDNDSFNNKIIFFIHETKQLNTINLESLENQIQEQNILPESVNS